MLSVLSSLNTCFLCSGSLWTPSFSVQFAPFFISPNTEHLNKLYLPLPVCCVQAVSDHPHLVFNLPLFYFPEHWTPMLSVLSSMNLFAVFGQFLNTLLWCPICPLLHFPEHLTPMLTALCSLNLFPVFGQFLNTLSWWLICPFLYFPKHWTPR